MSLSNEQTTGGAGGSGGAAALAHQGPRLAPGGYAAWRTKFDVYLQRTGAEGVHKKDTMTAERWAQFSSAVADWTAAAEEDAYDGLFPSATGAATGSSSSSWTVTATTQSNGVTDEVKQRRKVITTLVDRSRRAYGAIYTALPDDLQAQVAHLPEGWAYGLWTWLEHKFQSTEDDAVDDLLTQWSLLRQEDDESFDAYRARVTKVATLLEQANAKVPAPMLSHTLLSKLLPRYKPAVLALKAGDQLVDPKAIKWEKVTAFINAHEREEQRMDLESGATGGEAKAMAARGTWANRASTQARGNGSRTTVTLGSTNGATSGGASGSSDSARHGDASERRPRRPLAEIECYLCHQLGHMVGKCPKLTDAQRHVSGPSVTGGTSAGGTTGGAGGASRRDRPKRPEVTMALHSSNRFDSLSSDDDAQSDSDFAGNESNSDDSVDSAPVLLSSPVTVMTEDDDWAMALSIRGTEAVPTSDSHSHSHTMTDGAVSASPPPKSYGSVSALTKGVDLDQFLSKHSWGVDTMASIHVSGNRHQFTALRKCAPVKVRMADDGVVTVTHSGTVSLRVPTSSGDTVKFAVDNVYFHDHFTTNLLSMNVLREKGWEIHGTQQETYVVTPGGNKIELSTVGRVSVMGAVGPSPSQPCVYSVDTVNTDDSDAAVRLHERLGHMGFDRMVTVIKSGTTLDMGKINVTGAALAEARRRVLDCKACIVGKGNRTAFGDRGVDKGHAPGETLHMDTYHVTLRQGERTWVEYGLTVSDPHSEYRWFARLKTKDEASHKIIIVVRHVQQQCNCRVKRLYADGGSEFINSTLQSFCATEGIELHYPPARTQQLNGVAERNVRSIKDMARTQMLHSGVPSRFWYRAACHSAYVWNRTAVATATGVTPFESLFGRRPSMRHWGVFGCDAFYHIPKTQRDAFGAKMEPCVYLGHDPTQNAAVVWALGTGKMVVSRDLKFRMASFGHAAALSQGDDAVTAVVERGYSPDAGDEAAPQGGLDASSDSDREWEVERVVGKEHRDDGRTWYQIKWADHGLDKSTWEPEDMLDDAREAIADYEDLQRDEVLPAVPDVGERSRDVLPTPDSPVVSPSPLSLSQEPPRLIMAPGTIAAVPTVTVTSPAVLPRMSARLRGFDPNNNPVSQVHMVMSAVRDMQTDTTFDDAEVVFAVTAGVGLLEAKTPDTYRDATAGPDQDKWRAAMDAEMASCAGLHVWDLVPRTSLDKGTNVLPVKWVFKIKTDQNGDVTQHKARLTPKGFKQQHGKDYFEVYAATGNYKVMRAHLSLVAKFDHEMEQLDVPTAFLNADVDEDVYMEMPEGYRRGQDGMVCKLRKSLYGLKQAPRNWYLLVSKFIKETMGFKACVSDPCLFHRRSQTGRLILMFLFVDDFQVSFHRDDRDEWGTLKALLVERFKTKDMGESKWILGMHIQRDRTARTITLDQELYVTKALERYGLTECKVASTPEVVGREVVGDSAADAALDAPADRQLFMELTGTLMHAMVGTRLDIAHATNQCASRMQAPTKRDMQAAERILRYLAGTRDVGLVFGSHNGPTVGESRGRRTQVVVDVTVCAYADADWANGKSDRRSISGWVGKLNGDAISWSSKKQRTVALSTCEAELYAEAAAIQEVLWLRGLLAELGLHSLTGSVVYGDNQSAIAVSKNGIKGERTKHVDIKYHFVTETVDRGDVVLKWVPTNEQQADLFTKALGAPVFLQFRRQLMSR